MQTQKSVSTVSVNIMKIKIETTRDDHLSGLQRYAHLRIRYVSQYRGHDTIRITIHHKLFAQLGTQILNKENTRNFA